MKIRKPTTRPILLGVALSAAVGTQAFAAGYQVSVYESPNAAGGGAAYCGYNHGGGVGGSCQLFGSGAGTVSPLGGPGLATAASVTGSAQGQSTAGYFVDPSIHITTSASADLASATATVQSTDTAINNGYQGDAYTSLVANLSDTLQYVIAGANASTVTPITVTLTIDGTMARTGTATDGNSAGEFSGAFIFGPAINQNSASFDLQNNAGTGFATAAYLSGSNATAWTTNAGDTTLTYSETYDLTGATGLFPLGLTDKLNCGDGESCDYTAKLGLSGPSGFSYTSASGVFLTPPSGIPEPASWGLMLVGVSLVGAGLRLARRGRGGPLTARTAAWSC